MLWETINLIIAVINTTTLALSASAAIHIQDVNTYTNTPLGTTTFTDSRWTSGGWKQDDLTTYESCSGHMITINLWRKTFWLWLHFFCECCCTALGIKCNNCDDLFFLWISVEGWLSAEAGLFLLLLTSTNQFFCSLQSPGVVTAGNGKGERDKYTSCGDKD